MHFQTCFLLKNYFYIKAPPHKLQRPLYHELLRYHVIALNCFFVCKKKCQQTPLPIALHKYSCLRVAYNTFLYYTYEFGFVNNFIPILLPNQQNFSVFFCFFCYNNFKLWERFSDVIVEGVLSWLLQKMCWTWIFIRRNNLQEAKKECAIC